MKLNDVNIILEGCDCTGKSSIATKLHQINPTLEVVHFSAPKTKKEAQEEYTRWVRELNYMQGYVLDRFMLGEKVYAPKYRGYYPTYMQDLEETLSDRTILFLVQAHESVVRKRFDGQFIKEDDIPYLLDAYRKEFNKSKYKYKFIIDTTVITPTDAAEAIVNTISNLPGEYISTDRVHL